VTDYADDIMAVLDLTEGEPAVLLGHSLSALAAIKVAARAPERVRAIVLEDVPLFYRHTRLVDSPWFGWFNAVYESVKEATTQAEIEAGLQRRVPSMSPRAVARAAEPLARLDPDVVAALLEHRHMEGFDTDQQLRKVQCPVLLLQADRARGPALTDEDAAYALEILRQAMLVQVEGASHAIHVAQPQRVVEQTERFLGVPAHY
jgi:pimeloyl-ACP methyl ester carboxylesterase